MCNIRPVRVRAVQSQDTQTEPPKGRWRKPANWISESYAVKPSIVKQAVAKFEFTPEVDAFA